MDNSTVRVLLIEDDPDDYFLTRELLADIPGNKMTLEWAPDFDAGLEALARCEYDAYLLDYRLGKGDGLELLREGLRRGCKAPVILLTGQGDRDLALQALEAGAADYLVKGQIDAAALERAIRYALQQKRYADELERKVAARTAELARANHFLSTLVKSSPLAVVVIDPDPPVVRLWNAAAEDLFGWTEAEVLNRALPIVPEAKRAECAAHRKAVEQGRTLAGAETSRRRKDGSSVDVSISASPLHDAAGRVTGLLLLFADVTERKRAGEALRESEHRLRFVLDSMPQKIFTAKPNGDVDYFNPQWMKFTGLSFERIRDWGWTQFIHPDDVDENVRVWRRSVDTGEPFQFEHRFRRADGQYRWHISRALPLRDGEGRIILWVGSNTEVHELREAQEALQESDRRKDEFLATLAHELRNPLAPIRNAVQLLRLDGSDEPELQWGRDVIDRQVSHLTRLIDDLLDISRITRDRLELRKGRVALAEVVRGAVETSRPLIEQCGHELTVTLPPEPVYLNADLVRLAQVFMNLLTNAAKYTERGGRIWLTAELAPSPPTPLPRGERGEQNTPLPSGERGRGEGEVVVRVKDTGVGIPAEKLPCLFELFFQVDRSLARSQGGLGIGLSLVRRLVELHGGSVKAHSEGIGKGSEFTVRLPVLAPQPVPAARAPTGDGEKKARPSRRILVVDDMRDGADSLARLLRLTGNEVQTAYDGRQAVEAAERFRPDVVLLDIGMPKLNGHDACRHIREQPWGKNMVLIALTGWGQEEDKRRTEEAGFDHHLVKPVDPAALEKLLAGKALPGSDVGRATGSAR